MLKQNEVKVNADLVGALAARTFEAVQNGHCVFLDIHGHVNAYVFQISKSKDKYSETVFERRFYSDMLSDEQFQENIVECIEQLRRLSIGAVNE